MDNLELLGPTEITLFQSHIGSLQWCVTIGRFDIATAVITMSRYRAAPRRGHLERTKRMIGYLRKYKTGAICIRTGVPNYSSLGETPQYDRMSSVYGNVTEELPNYAPASLGKEVTITTYVDANLYHVPRLDHRPRCNWYSRLPERYSYRLVFQTPEHSRDRHIRF